MLSPKRLGFVRVYIHIYIYTAPVGPDFARSATIFSNLLITGNKTPPCMIQHCVANAPLCYTGRGMGNLRALVSHVEPFRDGSSVELP